MGKTAFLAQLVFTFAGHAGGVTNFLGMLVREGGAALVYTLEDSYDDWVCKAAAFAAAYADKPDALVLLERALTRVHVADRTGVVARLSEVVQVRAGDKNTSVVRREPRHTPEWQAILDCAGRVGARLITIETTSRLVDDEDNASMAAFIGACGDLAAETGAAVITSHHWTKAASRENDPSPESVRGGGALINNSRKKAVSLFPATPKILERWGGSFAADRLLTLEHTKSSSRVPKQENIALVRTPTPCGLVLMTPRADASPEQEQARQVDV